MVNFLTNQKAINWLKANHVTWRLCTTNLKGTPSQDRNIAADRYPRLAGSGTDQNDEGKEAVYL
jgi:hypothetical protein